MAKNDLLIRSAFLATKEKLPDKFLSVGKIERDHLPGSPFFFYLIEIPLQSSKIDHLRKIFLSTLERCFVDYPKESSDDFFEFSLSQINQSLADLIKAGEDSWIGKLNAVVGLVENTSLYISQTGKIAGYLFRKGKISSLTENTSLEDDFHPAKTFEDFTAGKFSAEDRIFLSNDELFSHLSLDRLRRLTDNLSAKESVFDLSKNFIKNKIFSINAIIIEAKDLKEVEGEVLVDLPEIAFLEPEESFFQKTKRNLSPKLKKAGKITSNYSKKVVEVSKAGYAKSKKSWQEKYGPKTREVIAKSGPFVSKAYDATRKNISPGIEKIKHNKNFSQFRVKTTNYKNDFKSYSYFSGAISAIGVFLSKSYRIIANKKNRKILYLALFLILIFIGYLKMRANNLNAEKQKQALEIDSSYDQAVASYNKAKDNLALGRTDNIDELANALSLAQKAEASPSNKNKAMALEKEIQSAIDKISKTTRLDDSSPLFSFFNQDVKKLVLFGTSAYGFGSDGKIYLGDIQGKDSKLVAATGQKNGILNATYSDSDGKIYILNSDNTVSSFDPNNNTISKLLVETSGIWETSKAIASFSSSLYLLDSDGGNIWKHINQESNTYAKGSTYTTSQKTILRGAVDIAIDGNIYVLESNGQLSRFSKGLLDNTFTLTNIPAPNSTITIPIKIFTSAQTNYIYVLDQKLNRVLRFDKSGAFVSQYALTGDQIDDFAVNDKIAKMIVLANSKIYQFDL